MFGLSGHHECFLLQIAAANIPCDESRFAKFKSSLTNVRPCEEGRSCPKDLTNNPSKETPPVNAGGSVPKSKSSCPKDLASSYHVNAGRVPNSKPSCLIDFASSYHGDARSFPKSKSSYSKDFGSLRNENSNSGSFPVSKSSYSEDATNSRTEHVAIKYHQGFASNTW